MRDLRILGRPTACVAAVIVLGALAPSQGRAACVPPVAPDPATKPERPKPPVRTACVEKPDGPGCMGWEHYRFNDEVKAFNAKAPAYQKAANDYIGQLNTYVKAASDYARCEANSLHQP